MKVPFHKTEQICERPPYFGEMVSRWVTVCCEYNAVRLSECVYNWDTQTPLVCVRVCWWESRVHVCTVAVTVWTRCKALPCVRLLSCL